MNSLVESMKLTCYLKFQQEIQYNILTHSIIFSSFEALKKSLVGVQKCIQATELSEASQEAVEEKLRSTDRQ